MSGPRMVKTLRGIIDDLPVVLGRYVMNGLNVAGDAKAMGGQNCCGFLCDGIFNQLRIDVETFVFDVDEPW